MYVHVFRGLVGPCVGFFAAHPPSRCPVLVLLRVRVPRFGGILGFVCVRDCAFATKCHAILAGSGTLSAQLKKGK